MYILCIMSKIIAFFIILLFIRLYVRVGNLLTRVKSLHDSIISLRGTVRPTKLVVLRLVYPTLPVSLDCPFLIAPSVFSRCPFSYSPCHFLLKCLYQAEKVSGRVFVCKGCRFCLSTILIFDFVIVPPV